MHHIIEDLRKGMEHPPSPVEIIRKALEEAQGRKNQPQQPKLFSDEDCEFFSKYAYCIEEFAESEDGKDVIKLLVDAFKSYVWKPEAPPAAAEAEAEGVSDAYPEAGAAPAVEAEVVSVAAK